MFSAACSTNKPIKTVEQVDIERFMGDWYVIANIPTFIEKQAHNAVENYQLNEDGSIKTTFTFRDGGFDGEEKRYNPTGFINDGSGNAIWGMQFIWPIKAEFRIIYLDDEYQTTIIGRSARDYVWLMARTPEIDEAELSRLLDFIVEQGYPREAINIVPHNWEDTPAEPVSGTGTGSVLVNNTTTSGHSR